MALAINFAAQIHCLLIQGQRLSKPALVSQILRKVGITGRDIGVLSPKHFDGQGGGLFEKWLRLSSFALSIETGSKIV
jgi:hypothetical protein